MSWRSLTDKDIRVDLQRIATSAEVEAGEIVCLLDLRGAWQIFSNGIQQWARFPSQ